MKIEAAGIIRFGCLLSGRALGWLVVEAVPRAILAYEAAERMLEEWSQLFEAVRIERCAHANSPCATARRAIVGAMRKSVTKLLSRGLFLLEQLAAEC
jgi:hypothetical protein